MVDIAPSVTSLIASSPSPKAGAPPIDAYIKLTGAEQPSKQSHSDVFQPESPPSSPTSESQDLPSDRSGTSTPTAASVRTVDLHHFHPYRLQVKETSLELCSVACELGLFPPSVSLDDILQDKERYIKVLANMPCGVLRNAYHWMLAVRECTTTHIALSAAELKSIEQKCRLLTDIQEYRQQDLVTDEQIDVLNILLGMQSDPSAEDMDEAMEVYRSAWQTEVTELSLANQEVQHIQDAMALQEHPSSTLDGDDKGDDADEKGDDADEKDDDAEDSDSCSTEDGNQRGSTDGVL